MPLVNIKHIDNIPVTNAPKQYKLDNEVHVWQISIQESLRLVVFANEILMPDEVMRASRYHQERDRNRFIISRVTLRLLLELYLDQPTDLIQIVIGDNKKPYIQSRIPLFYNVAHAGDKILIAVSDRVVGVDVEHIDRELDIADIAATCFSPQEREFMDTAADSTTAFYHLWTRKEALLKATGKGIDDDIIHVPALEGVHDVATAYTGANAEMQVSGFAIDAGYVGCVATPANVGISVFKR